MNEMLFGFKKTLKRQSIANLIAVGSGCLVLWLERESLTGDCQLRGGGLSAMGFAFLFGAILFGFWNWRCPNCRSYLAHNGVRNRCCFKCGIQLKDEDEWYEKNWIIWPILLCLAGLLIGLLG